MKLSRMKATKQAWFRSCAGIQCVNAVAHGQPMVRFKLTT